MHHKREAVTRRKHRSAVTFQTTLKTKAVDGTQMTAICGPLAAAKLKKGILDIMLQKGFRLRKTTVFKKALPLCLTNHDAHRLLAAVPWMALSTLRCLSTSPFSPDG